MSTITFTPQQKQQTMTRAEWVAQAIEAVRSEISPSLLVMEEPTDYRDAGATVRLRADGIGTWEVKWRETSLEELRAAVRDR